MIRTCDLCLRRAALYPLSYGRAEFKCSRGATETIRRRSRHARLRLDAAVGEANSEEVVMAAKRPDFFRQRSALSPELGAREGQCSRASCPSMLSTALSGTSRLT
jgi:hypothetical protein